MRDKSLGVFRVALFGISGMAILALAWAQPMPVVERFMATFIGSVGFLVAVVWGLLLRPQQVRAGEEGVPAEVAVEDRS